MDLVCFVAESVPDAVQQVRARLGPDAVVVQVRPLSPVRRGWIRRRTVPRFEVVAYQPKSGTPPPGTVDGESQPSKPTSTDDGSFAPSTPVDDVAGRSEGSSPDVEDFPSARLEPVARRNHGVPGEGPDSDSGWSADGDEAVPSNPDARVVHPAEPSADSSETLESGTNGHELPALSAEDSRVAAVAAPARQRDTGQGTEWSVVGEPIEPTTRGVSMEPRVPGEPAAATDWEAARRFTRAECGWRIGPLLESAGFLPVTAQRVVDHLVQRCGDRPPERLADEINLARAALAELWRPAPPLGDDDDSVHVMVGASGVGKTTTLCHWLARSVLVEGRKARVWRLDGEAANTGEALGIYCEVLGVPLERVWSRDAVSSRSGERRWLDLPGTDWRRPAALERLADQLRALKACRIHLVLNAAYETSVMMAQWRAFSSMGIEDVMITHLDEEVRWGKVWNLVVGINCSVRFLAVGQNVPGDFLPASAELLLDRLFRS